MPPAPNPVSTGTTDAGTTHRPQSAVPPLGRDGSAGSGGAERAHPAAALGGVVVLVGVGVVEAGEVAAGAADRAGPGAVHLDQADAGLVEPAEDQLDLLG